MIANVIKDLKSYLGKFKKTFFSHIFWEAKSVADKFANDVITRNLEMTWINDDEIPIAAIELIRQD